MFGWFSKEKVSIPKPPACDHDYKVTHLIYIDTRTDYHNGHDTVSSHKILKCTKCSGKHAEDTIQKSFPVYRPEWPQNRNDFIKKLEDNGFINSDDYIIEKITKEAKIHGQRQ